MSSNIPVYNHIDIKLNTFVTEMGSIAVPVLVPVTGKVHTFIQTIANAANAVVYNDELNGFNMLFLVSDKNTRALITDNASNTFSLQIRGTNTFGHYGIPVILGLDETSNANTRINTIRVFNTSGNTANTVCIVVQ